MQEISAAWQKIGQVLYCCIFGALMLTIYRVVGTWHVRFIIMVIIFQMQGRLLCVRLTLQ